MNAVTHKMGVHWNGSKRFLTPPYTSCISLLIVMLVNLIPYESPCPWLVKRELIEVLQRRCDNRVCWFFSKCAGELGGKKRDIRWDMLCFLRYPMNSMMWSQTCHKKGRISSKLGCFCPIFTNINACECGSIETLLCFPDHTWKRERESSGYGRILKTSRVV